MNKTFIAILCCIFGLMLAQPLKAQSCCKKKEACKKEQTQASALEKTSAEKQLADCPLAGTPDCPLVKNCPKKGKADCPYAGGTTAKATAAKEAAEEDLPACCKKKHADSK